MPKLEVVSGGVGVAENERRMVLIPEPIEKFPRSYCG